MGMGRIRQKSVEIGAARSRKLLRRALTRGEKPPEELIWQIIGTRMWKQWGYERVLECFTQELRLPHNQAVHYTAVAIKKGLESGDKYGVTDNDIGTSSGADSAR